MLVRNTVGPILLIVVCALTMIVDLSTGGPSYNSAAASAEEPISFRMAVSPPSPFQVRRAKKKGIELKPKIGTEIGATLFLPSSAKPVPLVIMLHDCRGVRPYQKNWAKKLNDWGYAAILIDSFTSRSVPVDDVCANLTKWDATDAMAGRSYDVFGAVSHLSKHLAIDPQRLAILSWDRSTALSIVAEANTQTDFNFPIKGAVSMSPNCRQAGNGRVVVPLMILSGRKNDWWPADHCIALQKLSDGSELSPISLHVYDHAYHSFDDPETGDKLYLANAYNMTKPSTRGATLGYNASAHLDSQNRIKSFLNQIFDR